MFRQWQRVLPLLAAHAAALHFNHLGREVLVEGRGGQVWRGPDRIDLLAALADSPSGSFVELMEPVAHAIGLTYNASLKPMMDISAEHSGGESWERVNDLETEPPEGGVHSKVFVSHGARRGLIAFRGMCVRKGLDQCRADACFGLHINVSVQNKETNQSCEPFQDRMDYVAQAQAVVASLHERHPDYRLLLVGHSLGGFLSIVTAAFHPGVLQAIGFAPTPFNWAMRNLYGFTQQDQDELPHEDLIAIGDQYDLGYNAALAEGPDSVTTCLFHDIEEPLPCNLMGITVFDEDDPDWRNRVRKSVWGATCKLAAHQWERYETIVFAREPNGTSPAHLPTCSLSPYDAMSAS